MAEAGRIRAGMGGWNYAPWRNNFYPADLAQKRELAFASRQVSTIEINATYYRTQSAASFARWRDETPDDFVFSVKASRYATNRSVLAEAGPSIEHFFASGVTALGAKLGPIVWQFAPTKRFDADDFGRFLALLPAEAGGRRVRHALDVRHPSFAVPELAALARSHGAAIVFSDSDDYPSFAAATADFVYARLMRTVPHEPAGYPPAALDQWADRARLWAQGGEPADLPRIEPAPSGSSRHPSSPRDVFAYFISGAKERAPAAACALISRL